VEDIIARRSSLEIMSESKPKGRRQGGRRNNNEATPGSTYAGGQLPQKSQQQQVQQQQQTHPEGGKGGKGGKGGGRGRNRNRAKGGQAATPNVDTNALNGGMNASANHSSGGKAADMFDEETALSRFRELLKSGDQGAKEVGTFGRLYFAPHSFTSPRPINSTTV